MRTRSYSAAVISSASAQASLLHSQMNKLTLDVQPQSGTRVEQMVKELYAYPPEIAALAAKAIRP